MWDTDTPEPCVPSPKLQAYVNGSPSGSLEPLPLKATASGAVPLVGVAAATAVGGCLTGGGPLGPTWTSSNQASESPPEAHLRQDSR